MYSTLKRLYGFGMMSKEEIAEATHYEWITPEQYEDITGEPYIVNPNEPKNINVHTHSYQATIEAE